MEEPQYCANLESTSVVDGNLTQNIRTENLIKEFIPEAPIRIKFKNTQIQAQKLIRTYFLLWLITSYIFLFFFYSNRYTMFFFSFNVNCSGMLTE